MPNITNPSLAMLAFCLSIAGCGGGAGGSNATVAPPPTTTAPTRNQTPVLVYDGPHTWQIGVRSGASVTSDPSASKASVSPALPPGITLFSNATFGGTPTSLSASATYIFTVSNSSGSSTIAVQLEVVGGPIFYTSPAAATVGVPMTPLVPKLIGSFNHFKVTPALPPGLSIDSATGVISGTATLAQLVHGYEIAAAGQLSDVTFGILLGITGATGATASGIFRDPKIVGLGYRSGTLLGLTDQDGRFSYQIGQPISFNVGAVELGTIAVAEPTVTPVDLLANGSGNSPYVLNVVRLLSMLDQDGDSTNGIQISAAVTSAAAHWAQVDFNTTDLPAAVAPLIALAMAADGGTHVLPDAAAAKSSLASNYYCTYSGGFVGTYQGESPDDGYGLVAIAFTPDGRGNVYTDDLATNTGLSGDGGAGLGSLDGAFQVDSTGSNPTSINGRFLGTDRVDGSFQLGADIKYFSAARIGGSPDAYLRFSGGFSIVNGVYPAGFSAVDADAPGNLTGIQYQFGTGIDALSFAHLSTFKGSLSGSTATVFVDGQNFEGRYDAEDLTFFTGDPYDTEPGLFENGSAFFYVHGCRLN
jgi:hypothetical protein